MHTTVPAQRVGLHGKCREVRSQKHGQFHKCRGRLVVRAQESMSEAYARIRESRKRAAKQRQMESEGRGNPLSKIVSALDFQEDIEEDRGLLAQAKRLSKGQKMSRDQYGALSRKVVGTKSGFFGETVDVKGKYVEKGYVSTSGSSSSVSSLIGAVAALAGVAATLVALAQAS